MTYANGAVPVPVKLLLLKTNNGTGSLTVNDIIALNTTPILNTTTATINSDNIVLGPGNYMIDAGLGINNSADPISNYVDFNLTVDGVAQSSPASTTQDNKIGVDASVCALSIETGTKTIKIKITTLAGTCHVEDDYSFVKILEV